MSEGDLMNEAETDVSVAESADPVLGLIDAELDRLAIDEGTRPYPWNTKWWMWREKRFNEGVNIAHKVSAENGKRPSPSVLIDPRSA